MKRNIMVTNVRTCIWKPLGTLGHIFELLVNTEKSGMYFNIRLFIPNSRKYVYKCRKPLQAGNGSIWLPTHSTKKNIQNTNTRVCVFLQCMYIGVYSTHVYTFGRLGKFVVFFHVCNFDDRFFMILNANIYILSIRINCIFIRSLIQYTLTGVHALCNRTYRHVRTACYSHLRTEPHSRNWALLNIDYYW